jgi:hypothetical protein
MKKISLTSLIFIFMLSSRVFAQADLNKSIQVRLQNKVRHPPPVPYFLIKGLCYGDSSYFMNRSEMATSVSWAVTNDKGDTLFTQKGKDTVAYLFKKRGFFNVCLTADNGHLATKIKTVRIDTVTKANFLFRACHDVFDNLSACADQFVWVLPDGTTTTTDFPKYKFAAPGIYPTKLIARRGNKSDTLIKPISVKADSMAIPKGMFTFKKISDPSTFEFTAMDTTADYYSWYFGDKEYDDTTGYKVIHKIDLEAYDGYVSLFITNGCGAGIYDTDPLSAVGIDEQNYLERNTAIYPNPTRDELNVSILDVAGKSIQVRLIDIHGRMLNECGTVSSLKEFKGTFPTEQLAAGIYFLHIIVENEQMNKKIVVQH